VERVINGKRVMREKVVVDTKVCRRGRAGGVVVGQVGGGLVVLGGHLLSLFFAVCFSGALL